MIAILGGIGAAAAWAISTLCSSRSSRMIEPMSVVALVMLVGLVITAPLVVASGIPSRLDAESWTWLFISGAGNVAGLVLAYNAYRIGQVALIAPLTSTEGAIAALIALVAGESLSPGVGLALALAAVGVCLAAVPPSDPIRRAQHSPPAAVGLAVLAALAWGTSLYATGRAAATLPSAWVVMSARLIGTITLAIPLAVRGRLQLTRRALPLVVGAGVCEVLGFYSYTAGARHGIAIAAVLSSQFATLAALGAYVLFGERLSRLQVAGVTTVIVGVTLLSALRA
jgi:drug/metabolite transporter (DMT)-like permease